MKPRLKKQQQQRQQHPPAGPLARRLPWQISVGRQRDGWVFALEPLTKAEIQRRFPGSCGLRSVFVGLTPADNLLDDGGRRGRIVERVLELLTDLATDDLADLGEFQAIDPVDGALLASAGARLASAGPRLASAGARPRLGLPVSSGMPRDPRDGSAVDAAVDREA